MDKIEEKLKRAEKKAEEIQKKYDGMSLNEKIEFARNNRSEYKKDMNIMSRYSNLLARSIGYAGGMKHYEKENR